MNPALEGQAGATSASGLSWTPKHMAERKEDGGAQTHGELEVSSKGLAIPLGKAGVVWCSSWALPPPLAGAGAGIVA